MSPTRGVAACLWAVVALACTGPADEQRSAPQPAEDIMPILQNAAERYVKLTLALGEHEPGYVDAYYGPEEWAREVAEATPSVAEIQAQAEALIAELGASAEPGEELLALRRGYLLRQLSALLSRSAMVEGERLSFDEESSALYDAVAPAFGAEHFQEVLDALDEELRREGHGDGSLIERLEAFRSRFVIPPDKLDAVFRAAIDACRERTSARLELPAGESFTVEYVTDKAWSAYNWYQGDFRSLIQVNTDLPIYIDRAIDLACHEGYPGHHVYNALLEKHLVRDRGWVEMSIYPLFSPQSLIAEGSANYGIEMAFPGEERLELERRELFPLAGLDPGKVTAYYRIYGLLERLKHADNQAARRYLDGEIEAEAAVDWLMRYAAMGRQRAEQRVSFIDKYRSYVINYNVGLDLVRDYIDRRGGDDSEQRWREFGALLSSPRLPSGLASG